MVELVVDSGRQHLEGPIGDLKKLIIQEFTGNGQPADAAFIIAYLDSHVAPLRTHRRPVGNEHFTHASSAASNVNTAVEPPAMRSAQCASGNVQHAFGALAHNQPSRVKSVGRSNVLADLAGAVDDGSGPVGRGTGVPILGVLPVAFPGERLSR